MLCKMRKQFHSFLQTIATIMPQVRVCEWVCKRRWEGGRKGGGGRRREGGRKGGGGRRREGGRKGGGGEEEGEMEEDVYIMLCIANVFTTCI